MQRWTVEVAVQDERAHLGVETQRQRSDAAIARAPPGRLALLPIVTWPAARLGSQLDSEADILAQPQ